MVYQPFIGITVDQWVASSKTDLRGISDSKNYF